MSDLSDSIETNAQAPKKVSNDTGSAEQHPLTEQIEADRYLNSKQAARKGLGIRHVKLIPPGND